MKIEVLKETVEAKSRRLNTSWTFEAAQDITGGWAYPKIKIGDTSTYPGIAKKVPAWNHAFHGVDVEKEIMETLANEIVVEIDKEILDSMRSMTIKNPRKEETTEGLPPFTKNKMANFPKKR